MSRTILWQRRKALTNLAHEHLPMRNMSSPTGCAGEVHASGGLASIDVLGSFILYEWVCALVKVDIDMQTFSR